MALSLAACSDDEPASNGNGQPSDVYFNVVLSTSATGNTETYVQALNDLSAGAISFNKYGFEVPSTRTARVYASNDGKVLYNLNYGGGTILKFDVLGGQKYIQTHETNINPFVGTDYPRWTKINDQKALAHNVKTSHVYKEAGNTGSGYLYTEAKATIVDINLADISVGAHTTFDIPTSSFDQSEKAYVSRIDAPVIAGGKAYYGLTKKKQDPAKPDESVKNFEFPATSLVVDYPSLENPKVIESSVAQGSTYGYRIPVAHVDERGDVYQMCSTHLLKISNGNYDNGYDFEISKAVGDDVRVLGWFYAGNGIGYATYYDAQKGDSQEAAAWGVLRVDVYNRSAIKMNTPAGLYLFQYQYAKVLNGKVYMALCPVGGEGNIYIFDARQPHADGFEVGAKLTAGAGASYIGVF